MPAPGTHEVLPGAYLEALEARRRGLQLRDTFLVIGPDARITTSFLFRHPLGGTAASTLLRHGQGALNIDACRVGTDPRANTAAANKPGGASLNMSAVGMPQGVPARSCTGRWPPNILIVHGPACEDCGDKRVRAITGGQARHADSPASTGECYGQYSSRSAVMHSDGDGLETIPEWRCANGCLVPDLDEQSGVIRGSGHIRHSRPHEGFDGTFATNARETVGHTDTGGASRFFPQFTNVLGLNAWVRQLLGA